MIKLQQCDDGLGICTKRHLCSNSTNFHDGRGVISFRFIENDDCHYLETCCDPDNLVADIDESYGGKNSNATESEVRIVIHEDIFVREFKVD